METAAENARLDDTLKLYAGKPVDELAKDAGAVSIGRGKHRVRGIGLALVALVLALGAGAFWYHQSAKEPTAPIAVAVDA